MHLPFGNSARRTLSEARLIAERLASPAVTPEHILLALTDPDFDPFSNLVLDLDLPPAPIAALRSRVEERLRGLPRLPGAPGDRPYTASAKGLLEAAMREARELGQDVEAPHLILGYLRHREGPGCADLVAAGITLEAVGPWVRDRY
jgi:ATP-dependent Clp protease ATP-binding subunit ClpA